MGRGAALLVLLAAGPAYGADSAVRAAVGTRTGQFSIADVIETRGMPPAVQARASEITLGALPRGVDTLELSAAEVLARAETLLPALKAWTTGEASGHVRIVRDAAAAPPPVAAEACWVALRDIPAGEAMRQADWRAASCAGSPVALRFDARDGSVRAGQPLAAGVLVRLPPGRSPPAAAVGDRIVIQSRIGPVRIERSATMLQAGAEGDHVFALTEGGDVVRGRLEEASR